VNTKRLLMSFVATYIVYNILGYLIHEVWLADTYASLAAVWRPEAEMTSKMWVFWITSAFFCFFFCYIFARGYENRGMGEGFRFGVIITLFYTLPVVYDSYVIYPIPYSLVLQWLFSGLVVSVILGIVAAMVYKPRATA
jgi:hypothetical protein